MIYLEDRKFLINKGIAQLLEIKDNDIRLLNLHQCRHAVDKAIHIGGSFSAVVPMVSLFYGGIIDLNIAQPTASNQDLFVLSKGHAVATLASIYSDLGYFEKSLLENSRSISSILNGHPGPLLPGVQLATGPMGQGMGVAQGFAIAGQNSPKFDVYALTGDGELQEGIMWETIMYSGFKKLENFCVLVDNNGGQLDNVSNLHFPHHDMEAAFTSFGWRVFEVDASKYTTVYDALLEFKYGKRDGRPTVIICKSTKGHGGFSDYMNNHKASLNMELLDQESNLQKQQRSNREKDFCDFYNTILRVDKHEEICSIIDRHAKIMGFAIEINNSNAFCVSSLHTPTKVLKAPIRNKQINYDQSALPHLEPGKNYDAHKIIESTMKIMALDNRIFSVDSDLASTSGLQSGVGFVDKARALNVGVAEANMMLIGEALAILGSNVWISTFCPFYDWKVLRRIAVGHQERLEVIAAKGWLSEGHGIDLTMVATAADLETQSNGATHMGNDDALLLNEAAHVKIINVSCPQQLLAIMNWIADGNKGIIYLRILRASAKVIYEKDYVFEFGKACRFFHEEENEAFIISTGRGFFEALETRELLLGKGISLTVIDMASIDEASILEVYHSGKPVFITEQNNGYLWTNIRKVLFSKVTNIQTQNLFPINLSSKEGMHYIHSGTYSELASYYELSAEKLSQLIFQTLTEKNENHP